MPDNERLSRQTHGQEPGAEKVERHPTAALQELARVLRESDFNVRVRRLETSAEARAACWTCCPCDADERIPGVA